MILAMLLLLAAIVRPLAAQQAGYVVIVNEANAAGTVSAVELAKMFLKKSHKWESGVDVVPVDLPEEAAARAAFSSAVLGKPVDAVRAFWQQQIFSGRAVPPAEKVSDEQVVAFVRATPGAVGYVSAGASLAGVKRLQVVR